MRLSDLERPHHSYDVLGQIPDSIWVLDSITIPYIAVIECNGSIRAAKFRQLFVPCGSSKMEKGHHTLIQRLKGLFPVSECYNNSTYKMIRRVDYI
jgi:hypothetical protein